MDVPLTSPEGALALEASAFREIAYLLGTKEICVTIDPYTSLAIDKSSHYDPLNNELHRAGVHIKVLNHRGTELKKNSSPD